MRIWTSRTLWLVCSLVILLAAACGPAADKIGNDQATVTTGLPTPTPTEPGPAATSTPAIDEVLDDGRPTDQEPVIILHQSGGIAGVMNRWEIFRDGSVTAGAGVVSQAPREAVAELLQRVWQTGFFDDEPAKPKQICCDHFVYTLTVTIGAAGRTHEFNAGDEAALESVRESTAAVQDFLAEALFE